MSDPQPSEAPVNGGPPPETLGPGLGSKRQRRPSVRLGDIGEQPAAIAPESYVRRSKHWGKISSHHLPPNPHHHLHPLKESTGTIGKISSKTRPLTNLVGSEDTYESMEIPAISEDKSLHPMDENVESISGFRRGSRDPKLKRGGAPVVKRVRSNWVSKADEGMEGADLKSSGGEDAGEEGYRDYDDMRMGDSESPLKELSLSDRRAARVRISESRDAGPAPATDATEGDEPSDTGGRNWNNGQCQFEGGVRSWLNGLGLGRYAPVFEIHEVDEEVLPLLTLEDLKDMGINAVGSRRKLYCAIQKLGKSFT